MAQNTSTARRFLDAPGRLFDVGGHRLHLNCHGEGGPAVVFDAALGASSLSWSLVVPGMAAITRACVYDRAGFAWSDAGPLPRTASRIADELYELLRRGSVPTPWLLVGHSYGGLVMRLLAIRHPGDVAGLVLIEPAHPEDWVQPSDARRSQIARGARLCQYRRTRRTARNRKCRCGARERRRHWSSMEHREDRQPRRTRTRRREHHRAGMEAASRDTAAAPIHVDAAEIL